jgi:hypothetical protein
MWCYFFDKIVAMAVANIAAFMAIRACPHAALTE